MLQVGFSHSEIPKTFQTEYLMKKNNLRSKLNEKKQEQSWFIFKWRVFSLQLTSSNINHDLTNRHTAKLPTFVRTAAPRTGTTLQIFSPETTDGEDALEVAEIKAYFSLDSAVCIEKPLLR